MSTTQAEPDCRGVHLVGSVPLQDSASIFRLACASLPNRLRRIPDGEPGERNFFVWGQRPLFPERMIRNHLTGLPLKHDIPDAEVQATMADLVKPIRTGYDDAAIATYATFCQLRDEGVIPKGVRFQVSLPTPVNVMVQLEGPYPEAVEPLYEEGILDTVRRIQAEIPAHDLAIQWDVAAEFGMLEGVFFQQWWKGQSTQDGVAERLIRLAASVDDGVELGFHLCYGDIGHRHFVEPKDMAKLRGVADAVLAGVKRKIDWMHMPVPKDRVDVAYFEPMRGWEFGDMQLYLGVVHANDEEGTRKRIQAARQVGLSGFGVASECGLARTPQNELESILKIARDVSAPLT